MKHWIHTGIILFINIIHIQAQYTLSGSVQDEDGKAMSQASVFVEELGVLKETDKNGDFDFGEVTKGEYLLQIFKEGYTSKTLPVMVVKNTTLSITIQALNIKLEGVEVNDKRNESVGKLRNVEEFALYSAKKSEVIRIDNLTGNVAVNNPRQVFKGITGLNIHENDAGGLQLSIGGRGLDPNRTANFNTRQNGYDISADALGYPESYYTPPVQALKRIEMVRGAASLQYGTQFGGLLNFVFKDAPEHKKIHFVSENTYGSNNLFTSFNSLGGKINTLEYYTFFNYKKGDGFRPASSFEQKAAFAKVKYRPTQQIDIQLEYTYMDYLSQQPGGLQDFEFNENPYQSKRTRNWFAVNWNLASLNATYRITPKLRINTRNFFLYASRKALGELAPINRPDPLRERDLIIGQYKNFGNETRLLYQYNIGEHLSTFLIGTRLYSGFTRNKQGDASDGADADFQFITNEPNQSGYKFPSKNAAVFAEHLFTITNKLSVTPGIRLEYIKTASDGYLYQRVISGGNIIFENKINDAKENKRAILLAGLGVSYRLKESLELYANASQNYRSINFTDLAIQNPNLIVDSLLMDEKGYNIDLGIRGKLFKNRLKIDATAFALRYDNRIGMTDKVITDERGVTRVVDYRTNIGNALILGLETYMETDILSYFSNHTAHRLVAFSNLSFIQGKYLSGGNAIKGNAVELIPPMNLKTGLTYQWKNLRTSVQYSYVQQHYSDATNAEFVANATRGLIPSYAILDVSADYTWKMLRLSAGINNALNEAYFTRRTPSYPGPGIIPAQGRNFFVSLRVEL